MAPPTSSKTTTVDKKTTSEKRDRIKRMAALRKEEAELKADLLELTSLMVPFVYCT